MMPAAPASQRMSSPLALVILICLLAVLAAIAVAPFLWAEDLASRMTSRSTAAQRLEAKAKRIDRVRARLATLSEAGLSNDLLLGGATPGLSGANLQKLVKAAAEQAGVNLQSLRVLDPEVAPHGMRRIALEVGVTMSLRQLQMFLHRIEAGMPLMYVAALSAGVPDRPGRSGADDPLQVTLTVHAFALQEAAQ